MKNVMNSPHWEPNILDEVVERAIEEREKEQHKPQVTRATRNETSEVLTTAE